MTIPYLQFDKLRAATFTVTFAGCPAGTSGSSTRANSFCAFVTQACVELRWSHDLHHNWHIGMIDTTKFGTEPIICPSFVNLDPGLIKTSGRRINFHAE